MFVLLLIASTVAGQARSELRMSVAETEAAQVKAILEGAFNAAGLKAQNDPSWPTPVDPEWTDGRTPCSPDIASGGVYPAFCIQALARRTINAITLDPVDQVPIRVVWKATSDADPREEYGWVLIDPGGGVLGVLRHNYWCAPDPDYDPDNPLLGPCKLNS